MKSAYASKKNVLLLFLFSFLIPFIIITLSWIIISSTLPSQAAITAYEPSLGTKVYDSEDNLVYEFYKQKRVILEKDEIPDIYKETLVAVEDNRFYKHSAIDLFGIFRALVIDIVRGRIVQGASTITQQLARNMYLSHETTIIRKLKEMILAFKIEFLFSKNEIITKYLNIIYFGDGSYGIGAAADNYFGKEPSELDPKEVALIIAMAKGPSYSPYNNERLALQRRNLVLSLMYKKNLITKKEYIKAFKSKIDVKPQRRDYFKLAPYFIEEIRKRISEDFGSEVLYGGGLKVYTTLDTDLQKLANKAVEMNLNEISDRNDYKPNSLKDMEDVEKEIEKNMILKGVVKDITENNVVVDLGKGFEGLIKTSKKEWTWGVDPEKQFKKGDDITVKYLWANYDKKIMGVVWEKRPFPQAALVAMNPNNGYVNALIGGSDYRETQYNRAVQSRLQIGSLVKPLYYTAAIDSRRFSMASTYVDSPFIWELPQQNPSSWKPRNYSKEFQGEMTLRNGLAKSINIVSAKLMRDIGPQTAVEYLHKLGIESDVPAVPSLSVGICELSPIEVTRAYSTFANMGKRVNPIFIRKIYNREGDLIKEKKPESSRVLSEQTSYIMLQMMKDVYEPGGTAGFLRSSYNLKGIVAGKSGTTNESADLWLTAMTPDQVITSWMGFDYKTTLGEDEYGSKAHGKGFAYILNELWKKKLNKIKDKIYKNKNKEEIDLDDLNITRHDLKKRYIIEKDEKNENNPYDQNETAGNDGGNDENISSGKESKKKKETVLIDWERPPGLIRMLVNPWNGKIVDSTLDEKKEEEVIDEKLEAEEKEDSEDKRNKKDGVIMYFYKGTEPTHYVEDEKEKEEVDFSDF